MTLLRQTRATGRRAGVAALLTGLALATAACGGGDTPDVTAEADATAPAATSDGESVRCLAFDDECVEVLPPNTIEMRGIAFKPPSLTVAAGTAVTVDNLDDVDHTITGGTPDAPDDALFDLVLDAKETGEISVAEPGTYAYFCRVHPSMTGELVVQ